MRKAGRYMNIKEFYDFIGENYSEVIGRLKVESRVVKYVTKFPADTCFETLKASLGEKNYAEAFRAAHTLKGICLNLGFGGFYSVITNITEKLRHYEETERIESDGELGGLMNEAAERYDKIISGISDLEQ